MINDGMSVHICMECGTSYPPAPSPPPPPRCPICDDERQYVQRTGQAWTTAESLDDRHTNAWRLIEPDLFEIHTKPEFAIGQRALLVRTRTGNFLWDCMALLDDATTELIDGLGGLAGIAISHPHYYTTCQDWAAAFDCPVHLHAADREWVMRPSSAMRFWEGASLPLAPNITLIRLGGHFPGSSVMYWTPDTDAVEGVMLTGDTIPIVGDPDRVTFLWSYPNRIPLSAGSVRRIADDLAKWRIDRVYDYSIDHRITAEGSAAIEYSARRIIDLLEEEH